MLTLPGAQRRVEPMTLQRRVKPTSTEVDLVVVTIVFSMK